MNRNKIFVSYRRTDLSGNTSGTDIARTIKQHLEISGYKNQVFFDYSELTDDEFGHIILGEIRRCKVMVLVLTRDTMQRCINNDDWVCREILEAQRHNLKIIPIEVDNLFNGYPDDMIEDLDIIKRLQHSKVHMDSSFESDMNTIIEKRIRPIIKPQKPFNFRRAFLLLGILLAAVIAIVVIVPKLIGEHTAPTNTTSKEVTHTPTEDENESYKVVTHTPTEDELKEIDRILQNLTDECPSDIGENMILLEVYRTEDTIVYEYLSTDVDIEELDGDLATIKQMMSNQMRSQKYLYMYTWIELYMLAQTETEYRDAILILESGMSITYHIRDINGISLCSIKLNNSDIIAEIEKRYNQNSDTLQ